MKKITRNLLLCCVVGVIILCLIRIYYLENHIQQIKSETDYEQVVLMPCPFCGGKAIIQPVQDSFYIECKDCELHTDYFRSKNKIVEYWNTRK